MLVSDLDHFRDLPDHTPAPALRLAEHLRDIVRAATAGEEGPGWVTALPCRRRPANRRCQGRISVCRTHDQAPISWECTACGDQGCVSGWQDTPYDLREARGASAERVRDINVSVDVAASVRQTLLLDAECERVVYGARAHHGQCVLRATDEQLDELLGYLAAEANRETNRRRRQSLDAAYEQLSNTARNPAAPTTASREKSEARVGRSVAGSAPAPVRTGVPDLDVARVKRWCAARVPERARHQVRVECETAARHLTIIERRAPWRDDVGPEWTSLPIARLRYAKAAKTWTLYWRDRNLRFHLYDRLPRAARVDDLLMEIDRDPSCVFWG